MGLRKRYFMKNNSVVLSINDFCVQHNISRNCLYSLWAQGKGPLFMKVGRRRLISIRAAAEWRDQLEVSSAENRIGGEV